jgi:hypothetical protein
MLIMVMINNLFCSERKTILVRYSTRRGFRYVVLLDIMPAQQMILSNQQEV